MNIIEIKVGYSNLKKKKKNYFQIHAAGFVRPPYLVEKGEKVSKRFTSYYSIETR